jgi:hypothetical protein
MLNFKVGDVVEQGDGTQWKIIGEHTNGLVWDVALVKKGPSIPLSVTIGSTVNYDKRKLKMHRRIERGNTRTVSPKWNGFRA